ncbi:hypothetical protein V1523DRAFT_412805 [Lipomyces doorenjongii]
MPKQPQYEQQQNRPEPFWNHTSAHISQQLWLPSSSLQASEWASDPIGHGWASNLPVPRYTMTANGCRLA